jgi:hypothetical protein
MTPEAFQAVALSWVGAITAVAIGMLLAYGKLMPLIATLYGKHDLTAQITDQNTARLNGQSETIKMLLLNAPPPQSAPAAIAPSIEVPINLPGLASVSVARPINVTVNADAPLSSSELLAAHSALDAQASAGPVLGTEGD